MPRSDYDVVIQGYYIWDFLSRFCPITVGVPFMLPYDSLVSYDTYCVIGVILTLSYCAELCLRVFDLQVQALHAFTAATTLSYASSPGYMQHIHEAYFAAAQVDIRRLRSVYSSQDVNDVNLYRRLSFTDRFLTSHDIWQVYQFFRIYLPQLGI